MTSKSALIVTVLAVALLASVTSAAQSGTRSAPRRLLDDSCTETLATWDICDSQSSCCPDSTVCDAYHSLMLCVPTYLAALGPAPSEPIPTGTAGISSFGLEACVVLNAVNTGSSIVCGGNNPDAACCSSSACFDSTFWDTTRPADPFVSLGADGKLTCGSSYEPACCPLAPHEL
ncbi:TPA: hypothetical protein ACH3X3_008848 [Trebouxia sp. C0006]